MDRNWSKTTLKLVLQYEVEDNGEFKTKTKSKTYSNVMQNAKADTLSEVASAIASLQIYDLVRVEEIVTNVVFEA